MNRQAALTRFSSAFLLFVGGVAILGSTPPPAAAQKPAQITVLYDAFGKPSDLKKDWGYSALIEYGGKRILFDTGDNADILAHNAQAKGIDLTKLDFVVMSHRHGDHMGGLAYVLKVNPSVKIYAPSDGLGGVYGTEVPSTFYRKNTALPAEQRYYAGAPPEVIKFGAAWPGANIQLIDKTTELAPDLHLIMTISEKKGTLELHELSLAIHTPDGLVIVVGCSHPGVEKIAAAAAAVATTPRIRLILGGFHLVNASDSEVANIVTALNSQFKVEFVAPGHCTGEPAFATLKTVFGDRYLYAGLGTTLSLSNLPPVLEQTLAH
jgi:7,8-dihydropterin-6-yl-methyl-4-(beta-D-ribofuranosyl)aminobenzene 5'-phosphate synthase